MSDIQTFQAGNFEITTGYKSIIKSWTVGIEVEQHAKAQLANTANLPFIYRNIAVMPDVHHGIGAVVGSVVPTQGAIVPSIIGVDIGCGMCAVKTSLTASELPKDLAPIRKAIEEAIPHGLTTRGGRDMGSWGTIPEIVEVAWMELEPGYKKIISKHPKASHKGPEYQLGTLGTGNHFQEISVDETGAVWIVLHSGSRGVGNRMATHFIDLAKAETKKWFIELPDTSLSYFPEKTDLCDDYLEAVNWCQRYAKVNREIMLSLIKTTLRREKLTRKFDIEEPIDCHHNYVTREHHFGQDVWVTRKGAICARKGMFGIIPGSMGSKSYIVQGKGNVDSFTSASHGAGRRMSRTAAKQQFTLKDHREATEGIECRKDKDVIDETPGAYKDIDAVMQAQTDLVEVLHTLKQVVNIKG